MKQYQQQKKQQQQLLLLLLCVAVIVVVEEVVVIAVTVIVCSCNRQWQQLQQLLLQQMQQQLLLLQLQQYLPSSRYTQQYIVSSCGSCCTQWQFLLCRVSVSSYTYMVYCRPQQRVGSKQPKIQNLREGTASNGKGSLRVFEPTGKFNGYIGNVGTYAFSTKAQSFCPASL